MIRSRPGWSSGGERDLVLVEFEQVVGRFDQPRLGPGRASPAQSRAAATLTVTKRSRAADGGATLLESALGLARFGASIESRLAQCERRSRCWCLRSRAAYFVL